MFFKKLLVLIVIILAGCKSLIIPNDFVYKEIKTSTFKLASWQKITNPNGRFKIYIEGDGASFDAYGMPTKNPTPKSDLVRRLAFGDYNENVVYLARPCQFVKDGLCSERHWTTGRFSTEAVTASYEAIKQIAQNNEIVLIGFSGGAQVAGLVSVTNKKLNVKKIITIGGNLDHLAWTTYHKLIPLVESLNLENYRNEFMKIEQKHYVGKKDKIIPMFLVYDFVKNDKQVYQVEASHNVGWDIIFDKIWAE